MRGRVTTKMVQQALVDQGFDPGPVDDIRGRRTIAALKAFQAAQGIIVSGLVDSQTARALFRDALDGATLPDGTPWMDTAQQMMGLHESLHNRALADFLASDGGTAGDPAVVPWCADFVQTCIALSMPDEPLPTNPYASIAWARFGIPTEPCFGAILCFWRESPGSWKGHVGFCVDVSDTQFLVRGGNQSDQISEKWIERGALRGNGSRWPATALRPGATPADTRLP